MTGPAGPRRALVLGGGGVLGFAWTVGALCAVQAHVGFDARDAEVVVGTSAGAVFAALLGCGISVEQIRRHHQGVPAPDDLQIGYDYAAVTRNGVPPRPGLHPGSPALLRDAVRHPRHARVGLTIAAALPAGRGSLAPVATLVRDVVDRTGVRGWPARPRPWLVAVDYDTGARVVFGRDDAPPPLVDAVVASCAIPSWYAPATIDGRRYIDGGTVSNASADLLLGEPVDEVYLLAPMASVRGDHPRSPAIRIERTVRRMVTRRILRDVQRLRADGKRVVLLTPGPEDLALIGANLMNPSGRTEVLQTALRTAAADLRGADRPGAADHAPVTRRVRRVRRRTARTT